MGGTIRVFLRSVRGSVVPNGRLLASAPWSGPRECCPTSGSHSERPRGLPLGLSVVVHAPHGRHNPGPLEERARAFGAQWEAPGFSIVASTPGVLLDKREPLREAVEVDQYILCCCSCPHGWDNPGVSSERAWVCGPQWAALGFGTVVRAPGVLPPTSGSHSEPYTAAGVTPWTFSFVDCYRIDHN